MQRMKLTIFIALILCQSMCLQRVQAHPISFSDTSILNEGSADRAFKKILDDKKIPADEKVKFITAYTSKGFRDLFTKLHYNPDMPYQSQMHPDAEVYMQTYVLRHTKELLLLRNNGKIYFDLIETVFRQYGLPPELKYLAVIESGLQTSATSWVGAAGPWQFMPATARQYGLVVTQNQDDRRDYMKSTHAAAKLLLDLYGTYKNWLLVLAAYNGGGGRVNTAIRKSGSNDFWKLQHFLPLESKNHVKKFIATHYVMESGDPLQLIPNTQKELLTHSQLPLDTVFLKGRFQLGMIAEELGIPLKELEAINPMFAEKLMKEGSALLYLPKGLMNTFQEKKSLMLQRSVDQLLTDPLVPKKEGKKRDKNYTF